MDTECGAAIAQFLTRAERWRLRAVCRRWHFTCPWLQQPEEREDGVADAPRRVSKARIPDVALAFQPRKAALNLRSRAFRNSWQAFLRRECDLLLPLLLESLPAPDKSGTLELKRGLCLSTNTGTRPSFENAHARSGYIVDKMNRCGNLPNLLLTSTLAQLRSELFRCGRKRWNVALYGGGPGFEGIGLAVLRKYLRADGDVALHVTVYDNEPGWEVAVHAVQRALHERGFEDVTCAFKHCDITLDALDSANAGVGEDLDATDVFVFSFVCVENFVLLERSDYCFLRSLFLRARVGSRFVFTDSTHRLWPTVHALAVASGGFFRAWTPFASSCHYALVLLKVSEHELRRCEDAGVDAEAASKLALFRRHHSEQLRSLDRAA